MKKEIYIIRHGETDYNRFGLVQGSGVDSSLNDTGRTQASLFHEHYNHLHFDRIYTSQLRRTHETVAPFVMKGLEWEQHEGLNEICWGYHEGKATISLDKQYYSWLINEWRTGNTHVQVRGGESPKNVADRQKSVLDIIRERDDEKRIMICMHGRAMRILLCQVLDIPLKEMDRFPHHNLGLYILHLHEDNSFTLETENELGHLRELEQLRA